MLIAKSLPGSNLEVGALRKSLSPRHDHFEAFMSGAVQQADVVFLDDPCRLEKYTHVHNDDIICSKDKLVDFDPGVQPWRLISGDYIPRWLFFDPERATNMLCNNLAAAGLPRQLERYFTTKTGLCCVIRQMRTLRQAIENDLMLEQQSLPTSNLRELEEDMDNATVTALLDFGGTFPQNRATDKVEQLCTANMCGPRLVMYPEDLIPFRTVQNNGGKSSKYWKALYKRGAEFWNSIPMFKGQYEEI